MQFKKSVPTHSNQVGLPGNCCALIPIVISILLLKRVLSTHCHRISRQDSMMFLDELNGTGQHPKHLSYLARPGVRVLRDESIMSQFIPCWSQVAFTQLMI